MVKVSIFIICLLLAATTSSYASTGYKYIGVCFHPEKMAINNDEIFTLMYKYHFDTYRTDYRWQAVEIEKGKYKQASIRLDNLIKEANKNKITPLLILGNKNSIYGKEKPNNYERREAFVRYASWVVNRYKNYDIIYEIYNEWWLKDIKGNDAQELSKSAEQYFELIRDTSSTIRSINPNVKVIAGGLNPLDERHVQWLDIMMQKGLMKYVDGVSIHPYSINDPDIDFSKLDSFQQKMSNSYNKGKTVDIYITEMGYSNVSNSKLSASRQREFTQKYISLVNSREYIKGIWWYQLINENNKTEYESNLGLLNIDLSEKEIMKGMMSR